MPRKTTKPAATATATAPVKPKVPKPQPNRGVLTDTSIALNPIRVDASAIPGRKPQNDPEIHNLAANAHQHAGDWWFIALTEAPARESLGRRLSRALAKVAADHRLQTRLTNEGVYYRAVPR